MTDWDAAGTAGLGTVAGAATGAADVKPNGSEFATDLAGAGAVANGSLRVHKIGKVITL